MNIPIYSMIASLKDFPEEVKERDNCIIPRDLWQKWYHNLDNDLLLIEIRQGDTKHIFTIETHHDCSNMIFIPSRFIQDYKVNEMVEVAFVKDPPPVATWIKFNILKKKLC